MNVKNIFPKDLYHELRRVSRLDLPQLIKLVEDLDNHIQSLPIDNDTESLQLFLKAVKADCKRYEEVQNAKNTNTRLKVINQLRSRVSFYGVYSMYERVERTLSSNSILHSSQDTQAERVLLLERQVKDLQKQLKDIVDDANVDGSSG